MATTFKYAVFVIGPPGSGKSTISKLIAERYNSKIISGGKELRKLARKQSGDDSVLAREALSKGSGANDELVLKIYRLCMKTSKNGYVFDGNPSGKSQARQFLNELFVEKNIRNFFVVRLVCPKQKCISRIIGRKGIRNDKDVLTIQNRFQWYQTDVRDAYLTLKKKAKCTFVVNSKESTMEAMRIIVLHLDISLKK